MKKVERDIGKLADIVELNHIGQQYAGSGNYTVAMKAWLRAAELGDKKCHPIIASIFLSKSLSLSDEEHRKISKLIQQWRKEGDEEVEKAIELQIKLRTF